MMAQLRELRERAVRSQPGVAELQNKIAELVKQDHALTRLQSKGAVDPALFRERHNRIARQLEETREKLRPLQQPDEVSTTLEETERLLTLLESGPPLSSGDLEHPRPQRNRVAVYQPDRKRESWMPQLPQHPRGGVAPSHFGGRPLPGGRAPRGNGTHSRK